MSGDEASDPLRELTISELVGRYMEAASKHGQATLGPDASLGNADADEIASIHRELRSRGRVGRLLGLLQYPDPGVRFGSASHTLEIEPDEAEPVLIALATSPDAGLIGFSASVTLTEWREGRLDFS